MDHTTRRIFLARTLAGGGTLALLGVPPIAHAAGRVEEADEVAVALGYRHDTHAVDATRYPNHTPQQRCVDCSFFQGAATDAWAGCAMFGRKQIAAGGWCSSWTKKPG